MTDDQTLVQQVLADRPGAFDRLIERHQKLVWHFLLRMTGNEEDAMDLTQEVFLRVFRKLGQYRFDAALSTWIGRVAYSIALRFLEKRRIDTEPFEDDVQSSDQLGPERELEAEHARRHVVAALAALKPVPRTIVSLHHLQGLTVEEIAGVTELPAGTVKSHLYRARRQMRHLLTSKEFIQ